MNIMFSAPQKEYSIAEGFHLLHFPLDESYVRVFTHTYIKTYSSDIETLLSEENNNASNNRIALCFAYINA